jgi:hypothetical protein
MLSDWPSIKRIKLTIPAQAEDLADFPLLINLTVASGTTGYDCSAVFAELGDSSLRVAVELGDTGEQLPVEIERWDAALALAQLWVRITLPSAQSSHLWLYYDADQPDNTDHVGLAGTMGVLAGAQTVLAMLMDGPAASTSFVDLTGKAIAPSGGVSIRTDRSVAGGSSAYFNGSNGYLIGPNSTDFDFGSGDFTIRFWIYSELAWTSQNGGGGVIGKMLNGSSNGWQIYRNTVSNTNKLCVRLATQADFFSTSTPAQGAWEAWALTRTGGSVLCWNRNGQMDATGSNPGSISDTGGVLRITNSQTWGGYFRGYLDLITIEKGVGRSTA